MEFRFNLLAWSVANILWAALLIASVDLIFGQVDSIAGWNRDQARVIVVSYTMFGALLWFFILPGLGNFSQFIREGQLDTYLHLPVNLRFIVSFNRFEFDQFTRLFLTIALLVKFVLVVNPEVTLTNWLAGTTLILVGLFLFYNLYFFLITLNFWLTNLFNLEWLLEIFAEFGRFPTEIFKGTLKVVFTLIIPVAYIGTFPARAFFGESLLPEIIIGIIVIVLSFILTRKFWDFALKRYSSASS